jgi:DNA repair protein RadA/Sms
MKTNTIFECTKCGAQILKWSGRCTECGAWGTLKESISADAKPQKTIETTPGKIVNFNEITQQKIERLQTQISEFDRVMGGGIVPGSLTLLGGEPGIGKSTLILQIAEKISFNPPPAEGLGEGSVVNPPPAEGTMERSVPPPAEGVRGRVPLATPKICLYVSGEESAQQIKLRIERLNLNPQNIQFLGDTSAETIIATIKQVKPNFVIIDSIQTITSTELPSEAGSINQIRACTVKLLELAKKTNIPIFIIGHITKDGIVAGPKTLEHLVDTVLYLEGDRYHQFRILRTIKNRFGPTNEVGIFDMQKMGLVEIKNPSAIFLENREKNIAGSVITVLMEGTRAFLVEVQALVNSTVFGLPQRRASGFDLNRLQLLIAVLTKRCGLKLHNQDVTINIAGGFKVQEPAVDLAVCLAIASAFKNKPIENKIAAFGEVGLSGEVRTVNQTASRIKEAEKLGFENIITFTKNEPQTKIKILKIKNLKEALGLL